ncbi:MAG TPA: hypothetical protein VFL29_05680 [Candidatus Dormibacteraeota bacterium]|nr:hypothetical protein [Candidatus Dormibacteraeota bacterium]
MGELRIEHDDQQTESECADCGSPYRSVIGVIYEDDDPIAIYRADVFEHFHRDPAPRVLLSIAVGDWSDGTGRDDRCSAAIEAWPDGGGVRMAISNRAASPWDELEVVSWQLTATEAEVSPLRDAFFRLADHIAYQDRRLRKALTAQVS